MGSILATQSPCTTKNLERGQSMKHNSNTDKRWQSRTEPQSTTLECYLLGLLLSIRWSVFYLHKTKIKLKGDRNPWVIQKLQIHHQHLHKSFIWHIQSCWWKKKSVIKRKAMMFLSECVQLCDNAARITSLVKFVYGAVLVETDY